jgi:hypothetical protein
MEHTIYLVTAIVGCTLLLLQVTLQLVGLGHDVDADAHDIGHELGADADADADGHGDGHGEAGHGSSWFFGLLSFKALVGFAGIFGLTGLSLEGGDLSFGLRLSIAIEAGVVAMVLVALLMRGLHNLATSGTVDLRRAVGHEAQVYLRVPEHGTGLGKVTVDLQSRSVEMPARTDGGEIPSGRTVRVLEVGGDGTAKVEPV